MILLAGILDSQANAPPPAGNISEPISSYPSQQNSRRGIVVEDDMRATQNSKGSGGGCC